MLGVSLKIRVTKILHHETDVNENYPKLRIVHKASSYKHPATRQQSGVGGVRWCVNHSHFSNKYTQCTSNSTGIAKLLSGNTILPSHFTKFYLHCLPSSCEISFTELEATFLLGLSTIYQTTGDLESMNSVNFLLLLDL